MDDHFQQIYKGGARAYHHLIEAEDVDANLLALLTQVVAFRGKRVVDLGTGTGRLPLMLKPLGVEMVGVDLHEAMLRENRVQRARCAGRWGLVQGDLRCCPLPTGWADVVTAAWAIGHFTDWYGENWREEAVRALGEMERLVRPGGTLFVVETMGTGLEAPAPPTATLADYYALLRSKDFAQEIIATDYEFVDLETAVARTTFFFGEKLGEKIRRRGWRRVPEWTGVWHRVV